MVVLPHICKCFFEAKIFGHIQLLHAEFVNIDSYVFPNTRSWANCYSHVWRQNYGLLCRFKDFAKGSIN